MDTERAGGGSTGADSATRGLLIDVRSPAEFAAGDGLPGAVNIEYTRIHEVASASSSFSSSSVGNTAAPVTLYCRSGRRSALALDALRGLGFTAARDLGGLEAARQKWADEARGEGNGKLREFRDTEAAAAAAAAAAGTQLTQSYDALLAGLREEEDRQEERIEGAGK